MIEEYIIIIFFYIIFFEKICKLIDLGVIVFLMCNSNIEIKYELVYELRKRRDLY